MTYLLRISSLLTLFILSGKSDATMSIIDCYNNNEGARCITIPILLENNTFEWKHLQPSPPDLIDSSLYVDIVVDFDPVSELLSIKYNVPFVSGKEISKTYPNGSVAWMKLNQDVLKFQTTVRINENCILKEEESRIVTLMVDENIRVNDPPLCQQ